MIDFETFCKQTLHCYACNFAAETSIPEVLHFSQFFFKFAKIVMLILISWLFLISTKNIWPQWYTTAEDFKALDADSLLSGFLEKICKTESAAESTTEENWIRARPTSRKIDSVNQNNFPSKIS